METGMCGLGSDGFWPEALQQDLEGMLSMHGCSMEDLAKRYGTPMYLMDTAMMAERASAFRQAALRDLGGATTRVSYAGKAFLSKETVRIMLRQGLDIDTCSLGEMLIAQAAGAPGRRLVLHGNNKSDQEIDLAVREGYRAIVIDAPDEPARIAAAARAQGRRAKVMLRVTVGVHAGGHEYISTAHEDQKFGIPLLPQGTDVSLLDLGAEPGSSGQAGAAAPAATKNDSSSAPGDSVVSPSSSALYSVANGPAEPADPARIRAMSALADGPAIALLKEIRSHERELELVGIHTHIGSQIHDSSAFIEAARRMMLLRHTFWATDGYLMPEVDLGGGFSVPYTPDEDRMDLDQTLTSLGADMVAINRRLGMPMPVIAFEPGRWIVAPCGMSLYRVGTVKPVPLSDGSVRTYVSVDGGMSDNIRPALYGAEYTAVLANRHGSVDRIQARVVGKHCESGDILVQDVPLPADIRRGDLLLVPVTGAYGRTMASNYNQALIPPVVGLDQSGAHLMLRRQTMDDLLALDQG